MAPERDRSADPLGRAMIEYARGEYGTLTYRDGARTMDGHVRGNYFTPPAEWSRETVDRLESLEEPILDVGCGAGQHALWFQDRGVRVTGVDVSPCAIEAARERGLEDALVGDMFDLPFERDRFRSLHCVGTQLGLGGSLAGIAALLSEFARVTDGRGVAVVDNYDPTALDEEFLGYRPDPREGVARRCFHFEYEPAGNGSEMGDRSETTDRTETRDGSRREIGPTLHFLLCSPARLREATIGTPWAILEVRGPSADSAHYEAVLEKSA